MKKILICGGTGFIGRNLAEYFAKDPGYEVSATYFRTLPPELDSCRWVKADLTQASQVEKAVEGMDLVIQAAASTSGAAEIVSKPYYHVTDNAVMNSLIFRACFDKKIPRLIFFSCTVIYPNQPAPVKESDLNYEIYPPYFGPAWTKVYLEKMCEFYSRIGPTRYTVIRHSNVYGPHDKYDLERSHVFGATVAKVMAAPEFGRIKVWGEGREERDLLHVDDLVELVAKIIPRQEIPFELVNVGSGESIAVRDLVEKIIRHSGKQLKVEFDLSKPTIPFSLRLNIEKVKSKYGWSPRISLDEGIKKTLAWYRSRHPEPQRGEGSEILRAAPSE